MYIIVGLGNPGKKYEATRHNMGFMTVDQLAETHGIDVNKIKFKSLVGEGRIAGQKVLLVKPQTYMNLSGEAVRQVMDFYKIEPEELIVVYDDIDIPTGQVRIRKKGSSGTHNGMRNILQHIQTEDFPRIRVGIGSGKKEDMINYVTGNVSKSEREMYAESVKYAALGAACIVEKGIEKAMNEYNIKPKKEKPAKTVKSETKAEEEVKND
ncbi:MAG: aminoacyl-tRNA hydrolase [Firmicutes bacterium]|nr:aminoacyl-tRNA hydrolase [Bacillota bacterium]